jgi:hypothetical protein
MFPPEENKKCYGYQPIREVLESITEKGRHELEREGLFLSSLSTVGYGDLGTEHTALSELNDRLETAVDWKSYGVSLGESSKE